jgi:hypothetical protein
MALHPSRHRPGSVLLHARGARHDVQYLNMGRGMRSSKNGNDHRGVADVLWRLHDLGSERLLTVVARNTGHRPCSGNSHRRRRNASRPECLPWPSSLVLPTSTSCFRDADHGRPARPARPRSRESRVEGDCMRGGPARRGRSVVSQPGSYSPITWTVTSRFRGPSNSAKITDWNRPRLSSPLFTPSATERPRSAARRWECALPRSQSENRGSS